MFYICVVLSMIIPTLIAIVSWRKGKSHPIWIVVAPLIGLFAMLLFTIACAVSSGDM